MKIQILGTGCAKCEKLYEAAEAAAKASEFDYEMEKVQDINDIMSFGVMITPAMAVDGEVKVSGRVPSVAELEAMLKS
ncbi:thioredoxin family protein [Limisalsivibrio acetivorans]|uniref:thioredoxin family protein n=1 Tax=Limisalsivibrio acetivorans TaxID=1304888 RepID=UPI0003B79AC7|nr:thioredoxin family protein [Limisalsivibrio acetivorans]